MHRCRPTCPAEVYSCEWNTTQKQQTGRIQTPQDCAKPCVAPLDHSALNPERAQREQRGRGRQCPTLATQLPVAGTIAGTCVRTAAMQVIHIGRYNVLRQQHLERTRCVTPWSPLCLMLLEADQTQWPCAIAACEQMRRL